MAVTIVGGGITGQATIDSYVATWVDLCLAIVNDLAIEVRQGRRVPPDAGLADAFAHLAADPLTKDFEVSLAELRPVGLDELIDLPDAISAYVDELATACTDGLALQLREQAGEGERRR